MINVADEKWNISHSSRNSNVRAETLENNCKAKDRNEYPSYMETNPNGRKTSDKVSPSI